MWQKKIDFFLLIWQLPPPPQKEYVTNFLKFSFVWNFAQTKKAEHDKDKMQI